MKITLHDDIKGPNGEEFEREAEISKPNAGDWVMNGEANGARLLNASMTINYLVLTPKKWNPVKVDRCWYVASVDSEPIENGCCGIGQNALLHFRTKRDTLAAMQHLAKFRREVLGYEQ
jgi:hypothetical protein